jgi:GntR family carbon starvation induced transcriptional regulator
MRYLYQHFFRGKSGILLETSGKKFAPLSEQALLRLQNDILNGTLVPGLQLKLDVLKDYYGFSSSPLREALNRLTADGLVINEDRRGFFVAPVSIEDIQEITRLRCLIEPEALSESILNGDDAWEAQIIASYYRLERVESRLSSEKPFISDTEWASLHQEFHNALLAACNSKKLLQIRTTLFYQAERYWHLWANANPNPENRGSKHERLRNAVLDRDFVRSSDLLKSHFSQTTEIVIKYLEQK